MDAFAKLRNKKVLLVEDNQFLGEILFTAFNQCGCLLRKTTSAEDGLQALEKDRFDIIISDFKLAGIDGLEFFNRATNLNPCSVRVLISGYGADRLIDQALGDTVHLFFQKPFSLPSLLDSLEFELDKR
jgi:DNA-binding NtrC family response regulator